MIKDGTLLAAVDLGSNSFRMEIGRFEHGQIQRVEYLKEAVRQGNGLDENRHLTPEAMQRGWACLARFAERLKSFSPQQVHAVATQTLREARNREVFIQKGCAILGFPIEVISGNEEARLVYRGVSSLLPAASERRLVIDVGGRSVELILGHGQKPIETGSFRLGSVAWSMKYFAKGELTTQAFRLAEVAAQAVLEEAVMKYPRHQWDKAYGSAGTIGAIGDMLGLAGLSAGVVTLEGVEWLKKSMINARHISQVHLEGLKEDRRAVIGGGLSVLRALMDVLSIDAIEVARGGLRHGVLYDMVASTDKPEDIRESSVMRLAQRFGVDMKQAERVRKVALNVYRKIEGHRDNTVEASEEKNINKLSWAAILHEVGFSVSHEDYHKHGAYIIENADMLGFTVQELARLSALVLGQRGKLKKLQSFLEETAFIKMLFALRMAIIFCHARVDPKIDDLTWQVFDDKQVFLLKSDDAWAQRYPQSAHLLRQEMVSWEKNSWTFHFKELPH